MDSYLNFINRLSCFNFLGCSTNVEENREDLQYTNNEFRLTTNIKMDKDDTFVIRGQKIKVDNNFIK